MCPTPSTPIRPHRFPVMEKQAPTVFVEAVGEGEEGPAVLGKLLDLSPGGAKVLLDAPLPFQQSVTLRLESDELELHLAMAARVCWIRPSGEDFRVGFCFEPLLDHEVIERLLREGIMDRRRTTRDAIDRPATASWELNPQPTPVTVVDLSRGGFCLCAPLPAEPHSRLRLQVAGADEEFVEATANVQWRLQVPEGYLLGCSLTSQETSALLRSALMPQSPAHKRPVRRRLAWCLLIAAACIVIAWML
jgi:hypothetical protein